MLCDALAFYATTWVADGRRRKGVIDDSLLLRAAMVSALCLKRLNQMKIKASSPSDWG